MTATTEPTETPEVKKTTTRTPRTPKAPDAPQIINLINKISNEAGALEKESTGGVPFPFRGIDGTINHLTPHLNKHGVVVIPEVLDSELTTRLIPGSNANAPQREIKTSKVKTAFHFYAPDGSEVVATTTGIADDFADRSEAQAQSVAFRVALLQTFHLPTQTIEPEEHGERVQAELANPTETKTPGAVTAAKKTSSKTPSPAPTEEPAGGEDRLKTARRNLRAKVNGDTKKAEDIGNAYFKTEDHREWTSSAPKIEKLLANWPDED